MTVFRSKEEIAGKLAWPVATVGSFDGLHAGHREIISRLNRIARETGGESLVITFDPHPRQVLSENYTEPFLLNSTEEKLRLMEDAGLDHVFVIPFTREFAALSGESFAKEYLFDAVGVNTLLMGYNHHFGRDRQGDGRALESFAPHAGFSVVRVPACTVDEGKVSSTVVRERVRKGDINGAARLLGRPYLFTGVVGEGNEVGYDFPGKLFPPEGLYPVSVDTSDGSSSKEGVLRIGPAGRMDLADIPRLRPGLRVTVSFTGNPVG